MTQKEIRDQVENLIQTKQTFKSTSSYPISSVDLHGIMLPYYNAEALNLIQNNKTHGLVHEWNRKVSDFKFEGYEASMLGSLLSKFKIKSWEDLCQSSYVREVSMVRFFGCKANKDKVSNAALFMVNVFNDLASKSLIRAVLTPLVSIELQADNTFVLVTYIAVDKQNESLVQSLYGHLEFKDGGVPAMEFK